MTIDASDIDTDEFPGWVPPATRGPAAHVARLECPTSRAEAVGSKGAEGGAGSGERGTGDATGDVDQGDVSGYAVGDDPDLDDENERLAEEDGDE